MSFERSAFQSLMPSTVIRSTRTGHSNYGAPTFSTTTTKIRARVVDKPGMVRNTEGEDVAYRTIVWAASTSATIQPSDRFTLPDGTSPPLLAVERYPDQSGPHHVKLFFGY